MNRVIQTNIQIADALLKLGQRPWGGYIPDIEMWSPRYCDGDTRIVGPAFTVKVKSIITKKNALSHRIGKQMVERSNTTAPTPAEHFVSP